jgi:NADPH:quinone reductase
MQAIVFEEAGDPAKVLKCLDVATPEAADRNVLVKVAARPIHPADLAFIRGQYRVRPSPPQIAGLEGAGVVVQSADGSPFVPGMRVAFRFSGSWADFAIVPADRLLEVPAGISDEVACQVSLNPLTAFGLLDEAAVKPGDWILLTAAASTVSNLVATMARARGVNVIGLVRGSASEGRTRCRADHVLSIDELDLIASILTLTGERRVSALLDSVGGPAIPKLFGALAAGGRIVAYGVQDREPAVVTNAMLIYSNLTWKGFGIDRWLSQAPDDAKARAIDELWSLIRDNTLRLPVASTHALAQFQDALAADARRGRIGKVLLVS